MLLSGTDRPTVEGKPENMAMLGTYLIIQTGLFLSDPGSGQTQVTKLRQRIPSRLRVCQHEPITLPVLANSLCGFTMPRRCEEERLLKACTCSVSSYKTNLSEFSSPRRSSQGPNTAPSSTQTPVQAPHHGSTERKMLS